MDIENYKEAIANADMAFGNDNYESALKWYDKALAEMPSDEYSLSRAGAALVALGRFKESFDYFQKAVDADPESGDNIFNLGNAYFFAGDISKAMEYYSRAELKPCSEDVKARIYYQMALMCTIKQDFQAALINYQKYEDTDKTGKAALDTEIISEKIQIYAKLEDYDNAVKYASKWVNLAPADLRAYMVYFNLLAADNKFEKAQETLDNALKYAVRDEAGKFAVDLSRANLYVQAAGSEIDKDGDFKQKAYDLMSELIVSPSGSTKDKNELVLSLGELCVSMGRIDEAIELMKMLSEKPEVVDTPAVTVPEVTSEKPDPAEIDAMMQSDLEKIDQMIANGELSDEAGSFLQVSYDENGKPVREYPEGFFGDLPEGLNPQNYGIPSADEYAKLNKAAEMANAREFRARVNFMLLSCYAYKEDYEKALEYACLVKNDPSNVYYSFFGKYSEAFSMMQLAKRGQRFTLEEAERKYNEEIAFFRAEMMKKNERSAYALIFRTRMYAEIGKFTKAEELAELMSPEDREATLQYIAECREELGDS